ncbi:hypothetical protein [Streptomyces sp. NPDC021096]|uniref:hypothetical protein n=1 Tax=Streptomyces sp. NPDC021096 TaxID=3154792 RepID=UPI0033E60995
MKMLIKVPEIGVPAGQPLRQGGQVSKRSAMDRGNSGKAWGDRSSSLRQGYTS